MDFSSIANKVAQLGAPLLASLVGGGIPAVATQAIQLLMKQFNAHSPEELNNALNLDPQAQIKLEEIKSNQEIELNKLSNELAIAKFNDANLQRTFDYNMYATDEKDRENARSREINLAQSGHRDYMPAILAIINTIGFFACLAGIILLPTETADRDVLFILLGVLANEYSKGCSFYLGSSLGSKTKDLLLQKHKNDKFLKRE